MNSALLSWFTAHQRAMPWRQTPSPYRVWVSEIMLQQTQVDTATPYFERFLAAFPTVAALAAAEQQQVLKLWEGLGYYARARNLHAAAQAVVRDHGGELPRDYAALRTLPGFGPYTAAAVASIAFGAPTPTVDGNVLRVAARYWGLRDDVSKPRTRDLVTARLEPLIAASGDPSAFNQGMMELGALICRPSSPDCAACPLSPACVARRDGLVDELPVKAKRAAVPHHQLAAAVIWRGDQVLLAQRPADAMLGGLWEFPNDRRQPKESAAQAAVRLARAQTGLAVTPGATIAVVDHAYTHFKITLHALHCTLADAASETQAAGPAALVWVAPADIARYPLPKAHLHVLTALLAEAAPGELFAAGNKP